MLRGTIGYARWDSRTEHQTEPENGNKWFHIDSPVPGRPGYCSDDVTTGNPTLQGILLVGISTSADIMVLCQNWLPKYKSNGVSMADIKSTTYGAQEQNLDFFAGQ